MKGLSDKGLSPNCHISHLPNLLYVFYNQIFFRLHGQRFGYFWLSFIGFIYVILLESVLTSKLSGQLLLQCSSLYSFLRNVISVTPVQFLAQKTNFVCQWCKKAVKRHQRDVTSAKTDFGRRSFPLFVPV